MRPGSAAPGRPGTGQRQGTGAAFPPTAGLVRGGTAGDVSIVARPVTSGGLSMRVGSAGPGRQVQDGHYFAGLLRGKMTEITAEIARMRGDAERLAKDSSLTLQLERRYEGAVKEVRALEGDLADYNLAMDKARTNVEASEIQAFLAAVKRRNEAGTREVRHGPKHALHPHPPLFLHTFSHTLAHTPPPPQVDQVLMERQERERGVARLEEQTAELLAAAEARIASLPPAAAAEYKRLQAESATLGREVEKKQGELEAVNAQVAAAEEALRRDRVRDEYAVAEKRLAALTAEVASLTEELSTSQLDPAAAREKLLARVKTDNARMQAVEKLLRSEEEGLAAKRQALQDLEKEIEERRGEAGDSAKYEALFKRDAEMTEFIDRFDEAREREAGAQRRTQDTILALLEHISEGLLREASLPTREAAEDAREDLADKQRELAASEQTAESLREQLRLRQLELEKIHALEGAIGGELKSLGARMAAMEAERPKHLDLEGLRRAAEAARGVLRGAAEAHAARREELRPRASAAARELEEQRRALAAIPQAGALEAAEGQLRAAEAGVFALREGALLCVCLSVFPFAYLLFFRAFLLTLVTFLLATFLAQPLPRRGGTMTLSQCARRRGGPCLSAT